MVAAALPSDHTRSMFNVNLLIVHTPTVRSSQSSPSPEVDVGVTLLQPCAPPREFIVPRLL
jgi:hypothetical protein